MCSYRDQLSLLEPIELRENETKRIDCPFCGGSKTFSITRAEGNASLHVCYLRISLTLDQVPRQGLLGVSTLYIHGLWQRSGL